jgi:hypothetical protein
MPEFKKRKGFKLRSGNSVPFKQMGQSMVTPIGGMMPPQTVPNTGVAQAPLRKTKKKGKSKKETLKTNFDKEGNLIKSKGDKSSTYKVVSEKKNKDGSKTVTYKNDLGNTEVRNISYKKKSPATKKDSPYKQDKKTKKYPKSYTEEDIKFLEEQKEDVVRREDLDEKGKKIYDANKKKSKAKMIKKLKKKKKKDWEPAFPGADHSKEELKKMTKKQKEDYYN